MTRFVLGALAGLVVGFLVAHPPRSGSRPAAPAAPSPPRAEAASALPLRCPAALGVDDLDRLRERIVADLRASAPEGAPPSLEPPPGPASGRLDEAVAESSAAELLQRALAAGRWTSADDAGYHRLVGSLPPEARDQAMSALTMAINDQKLNLAFGPPP